MGSGWLAPRTASVLARIQRRALAPGTARPYTVPPGGAKIEAGAASAPSAPFVSGRNWMEGGSATVATSAGLQGFPTKVLFGSRPTTHLPWKRTRGGRAPNA